MKKVTKLLSVLYNFLIFGMVLNINCRWPWEENQPITYSMPNSDGTRIYQIKLIQGNILAISGLINPPKSWSYAVVNAANKFLYLGSGIAGAIKDADESGNVQEACNKLLEEQGRVLPMPEIKKIGLFKKPLTFTKYMPTGSAWLTTSGDLDKKRSISNIIHAVGPNCKLSSEKEQFEDFLRMTYSNIFATVINYNHVAKAGEYIIRHVACPSLSTGTFACDLQKSAKIAAETIFGIMKQIATFNDSNGPTIFIMVAYDDKNFQTYKDAFDTAFKSFFPK